MKMLGLIVDKETQREWKQNPSPVKKPILMLLGPLGSILMLPI